ncbi:heterokaryon incompatibility, partial [Lepidopterella palustris CBS 459.81]
YTALSYCWADQSASQLKLTSANSAQLFYKIPMDELSAAQRDAITVTKDMGFLYLWNDALCIQQDDPQDFKDEADQMGQTYQYAACTITSLRS